MAPPHRNAVTSLRPDEWRRVRDVFDRAIDLPPAERAPFVAANCGSDMDLEGRVSALLEAYERADGFLETTCVATLAEPTDPDLTGARFGPYHLVSRIGGGGMGEVYRAHDTRLGRTVAVKVLLSHIAEDDGARERFEREARVVAGLNDPHICTLHDIGSYQPPGKDPVPYLVMEHLTGETLADRLAGGAVPVDQALDYALQIAGALDTAHRAGIVHRDLKPRNVMLTPAGVKLLDFGLAKAIAPPVDAGLSPDSDLTTPGAIMGTLHYMAPEQLEGLATDPRTDVFALGCVLYEMLSGRKAFEARSGASLMTAIIAQQPAPLRDVAPSLPDAVEALVLRCLEKSPVKRWQSAAEVIEELKRIAGGGSPARKAQAFRGAVGRPWLAAAAVIGVLLLSAAAVLLRQRPSVPSAPPATAGAVQLAVLPLRTVGGVGTGDEYLGVGIADSIITRLAAIRQIGLRPTAAVLHYAETQADTATVARELAVGHVLFGTIRNSGDSYRITLQLVQSSDGAVTWAQSYDLPRGALTNLQDTVAEEVASALRIELTSAERDRAKRRHTENVEAFNLYLRGRSSFVNYTERTMKDALEDFDRALAIDPDYTLARASAAIAAAWFSVRYAYENEALEWGARADRDAEKALADDPLLAEATLAKASAAGTLHGGFNWPVVIRNATAALAMDPSLELAHVERMRAFFHLGLFDLVESEARKAHRLNALGNVAIARLEVAANLFGGDPARAREQATALLPRSDAPIIPNYLGLAQFYTGDTNAARATLAAVTRGGSPDVRSQAALAAIEAAAGDRSAARARALAVEKGSYMDHHVAYSLGAAWAQLGDVTASVKWLQNAADTGFPCYTWMTRDRLLDPIRTQPEFTALLERLRQRYEQDRARYKDAA
jgi:non-specific serine/threonine protein kinase